MIELQIPAQIPSQNATGSGSNWRVRAWGTRTLRGLWHTWTMVEMRRAGVTKATGPRALHIIAYRTQRCADTANLIGGAKACVDGMTDAGLLVDDRDRLARITYEQQVASKSPTKKPHTTVQVTDLEESIK